MNNLINVFKKIAQSYEILYKIRQEYLLNNVNATRDLELTCYAYCGRVGVV
jgi:hypothetical protein